MIIDIARKQDWVPRSIRKSAKEIEEAQNIFFCKYCSGKSSFVFFKIPFVFCPTPSSSISISKESKLNVPVTKGFYDLTSGMLTQNRRLAVIGNNMTNAVTPGFKSDEFITTTFQNEILPA